MSEGTLASGKNSAVFGNDARATAENALALGTGANASGIGAVAIGNNNASGDYSTAMGKDTNAGGNYSTAMGYQTNASGNYSVAMGSGAQAHRNYAVAIGWNTNAVGMASVAIGTQTNAGGTASFAGGAQSKAYGDYSFAFGKGAVAGVEGQAADYAGTIAFGSGAQATHANSVALGNNAVTKDAANISSATIGTKTYNFTGGSAAEGVVSVGDEGHLKQIVNVANGAIESGSTDAVNGGQIFDIISNLPSGGGGEDANAVHYNADKSKIELLGSNGTTISNVKAAELAEGGTSAATTGQLYKTNQAIAAESMRAQAVERHLQNEINANTQEIREVGAISAALAGLHFAEPSGEAGDKLVGAVAYGGYRGSNAEAIGLAYKPSPNMMLSASTSISNGNDSQNAYNVGFSLKFGKGETAKTKAELQKQVKYLNDKNSVLESTVAQQGTEIQTLKNELEELKKLIKK
ncbi:MAG: YadA-like family protein [Synergistaceae bacterium]|nr:YadA-like family protein [Candidatus Equadaptatus faecalis]